MGQRNLKRDSSGSLGSRGLVERLDDRARLRVRDSDLDRRVDAHHC